MTHDRLYRDGTGNVVAVTLDQVEQASWLLPADHDGLGIPIAPINGEPAGIVSELAAGIVPEPGDVNRTMLVYPADRPPEPLSEPVRGNRAQRRAARKRRAST